MNIASLATTLPMLLVGMLGIFIVIGVIILAVYLLNRVTHHSDESCFLPHKKPRGPVRGAFVLHIRRFPWPQRRCPPSGGRCGCRWWGRSGRCAHPPA